MTVWVFAAWLGIASGWGYVGYVKGVQDTMGPYPSKEVCEAARRGAIFASAEFHEDVRMRYGECYERREPLRRS